MPGSGYAHAMSRGNREDTHVPRETQVAQDALSLAHDLGAAASTAPRRHRRGIERSLIHTLAARTTPDAVDVSTFVARCDGRAKRFTALARHSASR